MRTLQVRLPDHPKAAARASYVMDWLAAHPYAKGGLRWQCVTTDWELDLAKLTQSSPWLSYAADDPRVVEALSAAPPARVRHAGEWLYGLGVKRSSQFVVALAYAFDWTSTLFSWLSRWEERCGGQTDPRPPAARTQWLVRHALEREPRADRLAAALLASWGITVELAPTRVLLTHDLDHVRLWQRPWTPLRYGAYVARKGGGFAALSSSLGHAIGSTMGKATDPYANPEQTLLPGGGVLFLLLGRRVRQDGGADRTDEAVRHWIDAAHELGYTCGLHPSFTTPADPVQLRREVERFRDLLGKGADVSRQHFLRWHWGVTEHQLTATGIHTDSTLGYRNRLGFRCATSFPYALYDFAREAAGPLVEWPLAAMDTAWMEANDYDPARCAADWSDFTRANGRGCDLVLNIHNSTHHHALLAGIDLQAWYQFVGSRERAPLPSRALP